MYAAVSCIGSLLGSCLCTGFLTISKGVMTKARAGYCFLFTLSIIVSWIFRDYSKPLLDKIPWIVKREFNFEPSDAWFGQQAVYRISFGSFLFYGLHALILIGVRYRKDHRSTYIHNSNWAVKLFSWMAFLILPFFFPNGLVTFYGNYIARFGSGIFLVIQMIILMDFAFSWNEYLVEKGEEDEQYYNYLMILTLLFFAGTLGVSGYLFYWFTPQGSSCSLNISLITLQLVICLTVSVMTLHPEIRVNGSLFLAASMGLYIMYLMASGLQSEPHNYVCNSLGKRIDVLSWTSQALGMGLALTSVVYAAFRAGAFLPIQGREGSNTRAFTLDDNDDEETQQPLIGSSDAEAGPSQFQKQEKKGGAMDDYEPVTYNYSFFHMIFCLASMYIAMLMTGWGQGAAPQQAVLDVGWTSVWIKISASWVTALLYIWTLIAPLVLPDREFR